VSKNENVYLKSGILHFGLKSDDREKLTACVVQIDSHVKKREIIASSINFFSA